MAWHDGLLPEQKTAAEHTGSHARLLAGPGTGKTLTLTRHVCFLVTGQEVDHESIVVVTFTRAAASELRQRIHVELGEERCPGVSTLHSFALRQLLRNAARISTLPQPLRIADDWEERNVVLEDMKSLLNLSRISEARDLLNELSADWQSLTAEEADWERRFPNPQFLGVWREHRQIYGYTLRSELVYQLKKALEQCDDFQLDGPVTHLLIDEYQDLNRCDLAVLHGIASRNVELYVAGDDDQSIYGFRKAHPEGIRRFPRDYYGARELSLEVCKRCDPSILDLGLFVARQDPRRLPKTIRPEDDRDAGEVVILKFRDQEREAEGIAQICVHLVNECGLQPDSILILLRSDYKGAFTDPIREKINNAGLSAAEAADAANLLDSPDGRALLAFMRLAVFRGDSLAWRTLFEVWCNGVGPGAIGALYDLARSRGWSFAQAVLAGVEDDQILPSNHRGRISDAAGRIVGRLDELFPEELGDSETSGEVIEAIQQAAKLLVHDERLSGKLVEQLRRMAESVDARSIREVLRATDVSKEEIEQDLERGKVNILTMHRAKGLTADAVIVAAAEDQYIPGRAKGDAVDDERRLLYVSLTRAKHHLFVTYCNERTGPQQYTGRDSGTRARSLTSFLVDSPLPITDGRAFIRRLAGEQE